MFSSCAISAEHTNHPIEKLDLSDLTAGRTWAQFLAFIEETRGNSVATCNARLAALHTLARFLASDSPDRLAQWQRILALPVKRGAAHTPIEYLKKGEVQALLDHIDRSTRAGQRDYAMFCLMPNTGARVQEISRSSSQRYQNRSTISGSTQGKGWQDETLPNLGTDCQAAPAPCKHGDKRW